MCRIFYNASKTIDYEAEVLWKFLARLEVVGGKDGNGIYVNKTGILEKYATLMPDWVEADGEFMFHTRHATNGKVSDTNCQPFEGKRYVMAHNGIFSSVESYANLLGFHKSTDKYSDSYMMHWIIEKVGILNFYLAFSNKVYGVVVVHDKVLKKTFLLKTGGVFESGVLEGTGKLIYGSSELDFWKLDEKPRAFGSGLYRLGETEAIKLHELKRKYNYKSTYKGGYGNYGGGYPDYTGYNTKKNHHKKKGKGKQYKKKSTQTSKTTEITTSTTADTDDNNIKTAVLVESLQAIADRIGKKYTKEQPRGIENLFINEADAEDGEPVEYFATDGQRCALCGYEFCFDEQVFLKDEKEVCWKCDNNDLLKNRVTCKNCEQDVGEVYYQLKNGVAFCEKCHDIYEEIGDSRPKIPTQCMGCSWINKSFRCAFHGVQQDSFNFTTDEDLNLSKCHSGYSATKEAFERFQDKKRDIEAETTKKTEKTENEDDTDYCEGCGGDKVGYCSQCGLDRDVEDAEIIKLYSDGREAVVKCHYCGYFFEALDDRFKDKKGHIICDDCADFIGLDRSEDKDYKYRLKYQLEDDYEIKKEDKKKENDGYAERYHS